MRELEQFSYAVAHDFLIPLRAIEATVTALRSADPRPSPDVLFGLDQVRHHQAAMAAMIDRLLELTRAASRPLQLATIDMEALVRDAWQEIKAPKSAELTVGKLPRARVDPSMLKLVWANLLANALRYTAGQRMPRIEVSGGESSDHVIYAVRDNGVGFDLGFSGKLFYVYERIQERYPGTGVGLAIVQRLVTRHRGNVWVEAHQDQGAFFQFSLPSVAIETLGAQEVRSP